MASESDHFSLLKLNELLKACYNESGVICLDNYVNAYNEITKLLKLMGTVFGFVNSDVVEKIGILSDYRKSDVGDHFKTIQSMIEYEVAHNLTNNKKKASGSRTLLRLHRALEFIADFLLAVKESDEHAKLSGVCSKSYYRTLAKHHPWIIRKGVDVAVYTIPSRKHFMDKLKVHDIKETEELLDSTGHLGKKIFDVVEKLYADHNLHDLP